MPTSACCRLDAYRPGAAGSLRSHGFTLLEVLVVMVLVGLLSALAVPNLQRIVDSVESSTRRKTVLADVAGLGYRAYVLGQSFELGREAPAQILRDGLPVLAVPAGWRLEIPEPIRYSFSGFCSGGRVNLREPDGAETRLRLQAPLCRVDLATP